MDEKPVAHMYYSQDWQVLAKTVFGTGFNWLKPPGRNQLCQKLAKTPTREIRVRSNKITAHLGTFQKFLMGKPANFVVFLVRTCLIQGAKVCLGVIGTCSVFCLTSFLDGRYLKYVGKNDLITHT